MRRSRTGWCLIWAGLALAGCAGARGRGPTRGAEPTTAVLRSTDAGVAFVRAQAEAARRVVADARRAQDLLVLSCAEDVADKLAALERVAEESRAVLQGEIARRDGGQGLEELRLELAKGKAAEARGRLERCIGAAAYAADGSTTVEVLVDGGAVPVVRRAVAMPLPAAPLSTR